MACPGCWGVTSAGSDRADLSRKPLVVPRLCGNISLFSRCSHTAKVACLLWGQWGIRARICPEIQSPPFYETHTNQNEHIQWADLSCHHGQQKQQTLKPRVTWELTSWFCSIKIFSFPQVMPFIGLQHRHFSPDPSTPLPSPLSENFQSLPLEAKFLSCRWICQ